MFRFFRKHSWILIVVITLTVLSFLIFMGNAPSRGRGNNRGGDTEFGQVYGHVITQPEYEQAKNDFELYYRANQGEWPTLSRNFTQFQMDQQIYVNLMLLQKAKSLGVSVSDQAVVTAAAEMLASPDFNRNMGNRTSQQLDMHQLVEQVLAPHGLTDLDFQYFIRTRLIVEQLQLSLGLPGALITPQEAESLYDHDHQQATVQAVFFSASNYLDHVKAAPAAVGEFFTNYMAYYRLPDRVQVNYIWLNVTNYLTQSREEWAKTNLETVVDHYLQTDAAQFPEAKTPEEKKAKIREALIRARAGMDAKQKAEDFITTLFAMNPVKPENFVAVAKQKGLTVRTSEPFSQNGGEDEFPNAPEVPKAAFALNQDTPFSDMIGGEDGIYLIGMQAQLPSSMPAFNEIAGRVTQDYKMQSAIALARTTGTNFYYSATMLIATGKTLAQAAVAKGLVPVSPEPFSLSSRDIPELGDHAELGPFKQATFSTPAGSLSHFVNTPEGGFLVYVKSLAPPDMAAKAADLPAFTSQLRRGRENEAFNLWINSEANREFPHIPALVKDQMDAQRQP